jgi:hypothetical protein
MVDQADSALPCIIDGCPDPAYCRLWCRGHYHKFQRYGDPLTSKGPGKGFVPKNCSVDGCPRNSTRKGLCAKHYVRLRKTGTTDDPPPFKRLPILVSGYMYLIRPDHPNSYKNGRVAEHVAVMAEMLGRPLVDGENVHHKNGVKTDNRPDNLELWCRPQPHGIRAEDALAWAREVIARYGEAG